MITRRIIDLLVTAGRQAVPVGGIFALEWQPAVALGAYWLESLLLTFIAVELCVRLRARTPATDMAAVHAAGIDPRDVLLFHGGSLAVFGVFFASIILILTMNGRIDPLNWSELGRALGGVVSVIVVGFVIDRLLNADPPLALVQARVNAGNGRWALMWLLGFGGTAAMAFTGDPQVFFQVFAVLKLTWELWGAAARTFGWRPVQDSSPARAYDSLRPPS